MLTVFLVDDDIDDQEIFLFVMKEAYSQAECILAQDGIQALEKLRDTSFLPDIIFVDINMPRMNGTEFLLELKKMSRLSNTPVFMYSTSYEQEIVARCKNLGATGFVKKYADTDEVKREFLQIFSNLNAHG
ncbi:MAG: response regulator [Dyadobacter sp.]|uniref:response regulator n=1 Tax=Dyadobacter sp. TaxID=1914288 RepID=UPI003263C53B